VLRNIKQKIQDKNLLIAKVHNGRTIVTMQEHKYEQQIQNNIHNNTFTPITQDPTNLYQITIKSVINNCASSILKERKVKQGCKNPDPPRQHAAMKIHANSISIRPIVNWRNALP
jgi:hypothetical protein